MANGENAAKIYLKPKEFMLNAIHDLAELQRAEETYDDISRGIIHFRVEMYSFSWEYRFTVEKKDENNSFVTLEIAGEVTDKADRIHRQFALLDSMIPGSAGAEPADPDLSG